MRMRGWTGIAALACLALAPLRADERAESLTRYFTGMKSELAGEAAEFIAAADRYRLDWRLLPALAVVETAAGRLARDHNLFGWGRIRFDSARAAIWHVAEALGEGERYRDKATRAKLVEFNRRHRRFPARVIKTMDAIGAFD